MAAAHYHPHQQQRGSSLTVGEGRMSSDLRQRRGNELSAPPNNNYYNYYYYSKTDKPTSNPRAAPEQESQSPHYHHPTRRRRRKGDGWSSSWMKLWSGRDTLSSWIVASSAMLLLAVTLLPLFRTYSPCSKTPRQLSSFRVVLTASEHHDTQRRRRLHDALFFSSLGEVWGGPAGPDFDGLHFDTLAFIRHQGLKWTRQVIWDTQRQYERDRAADLSAMDHDWEDYFEHWEELDWAFYMDPDQSNGCIRLKWTEELHPSCNTFHELNIAREVDETLQPYQRKYLAHGFFRDSWLLESNATHDDVFVLKAMRLTNDDIDFDYFFGSHIYREAITMERTHASAVTMSLYGHCSTSMLVERAYDVSQQLAQGVEYDGRGRIDVEDLKRIELERTNGTDVYPFNNFTTYEKLRMALSMARSLAELHGHQDGVICNDDVHPDQWLADKHGQLKLNDFSNTRMLQWNVRTGEYCPYNIEIGGDYRSPEQQNELPVTEQSDVWPLGANIHVLLSGLFPYYWEWETEPLQELVANGQLPVLDARYHNRSYIEGRLYEIMMACFTVDPQERVTVFEVVEYLQETLDAVHEMQQNGTWIEERIPQQASLLALRHDDDEEGDSSDEEKTHSIESAEAGKADVTSHEEEAKEPPYADEDAGSDSLLYHERDIVEVEEEATSVPALENGAEAQATAEAAGVESLAQDEVAVGVSETFIDAEDAAEEAHADDDVAYEDSPDEREPVVLSVVEKIAKALLTLQEQKEQQALKKQTAETEERLENDEEEPAHDVDSVGGFDEEANESHSMTDEEDERSAGEEEEESAHDAGSSDEADEEEHESQVEDEDWNEHHSVDEEEDDSSDDSQEHDDEVSKQQEEYDGLPNRLSESQGATATRHDEHPLDVQHSQTAADVVPGRDISHGNTNQQHLQYPSLDRVHRPQDPMHGASKDKHADSSDDDGERPFDDEEEELYEQRRRHPTERHSHNIEDDYFGRVEPHHDADADDDYYAMGHDETGMVSDSEDDDQEGADMHEDIETVEHDLKGGRESAPLTADVFSSSRLDPLDIST